jgi:hypothetical protein
MRRWLLARNSIDNLEEGCCADVKNDEAGEKERSEHGKNANPR